MKRKAILLILLLGLLLVNAVQAGSSASYALDWMIPLTSGGGGQAESANYAVNYSLGQTSIGSMASTGYGLKLGFWQEFIQSLANLFVWLPVILK
jgi:hypothetical protein